MVINIQQLGALLLVYPFLSESDNIGTLLSQKEVEYMIKYLVKSIKKYFEDICSFEIYTVEKYGDVEKIKKRRLTHFLKI